MAYHARRILLIFASHLDDSAALQKDIQHYEQRMRRIAVLGLPLPEYFILVVAPSVSAYLQCTPEIQAYVKRSIDVGIKRLEQIGTALGIPPERQCFAEGNRDLEAWRVSKVLCIDEVHGYTKGFACALALWENIRIGWQRLFNKRPCPRTGKRRRQPSQRAVGTGVEHRIKK